MENKSIIALSMHKAGSSILDLILTDFCKAKGMKIDRISLAVPSSPLSEAEIFLKYQEKILLNGIYYGVARGPYVKDMTILPKLRLLIQIRDPRDCITSAYFSFKKSHIPPKNPEKLKAFMERRNQLEKMDIDSYAISQSAGYHFRMTILKNIINNHDDYLLVKYEDMVENTDKWLNQISDFIKQPITKELVQTLGGKINFSVDKEDISKHKRQVSPGDHKRKLRLDTIERFLSRICG